MVTQNEKWVGALEAFKIDLIKLCKKYNFKLKGSEDCGITIEIILSETDGYSRELQDCIWNISPDGVEADD